MSKASKLPARWPAAEISVEAATLLHSATYDAVRLGQAQGLASLTEEYQHLYESRRKLADYISRLERLLHIPQQVFYRLD